MKIALIGEPILSSMALSVPMRDIPTREFQLFLDQLLDTMLQASGIGIAAPQVFDSRAVMIIASRPNARYPDAPQMEPLILINPTIVKQSGDKIKDWEGCLSVPALRGKVARPKWVEIEYINRSGQSQTIRFEGFVARIFLHEFDHLIGKTWLDHIDSTTDIMADAVWREMFLV